MNHHGRAEANHEDESQLVVRSRGGDAAAFEQLVGRTARWLFARLYLQVGDAHRAEDLVQETYLRAWRKLSGLSDPKAFRGWLMTIATGVALDSAKRESRKKRGGFWRGSDQHLMKLADATPPPPESIEKDEERKRMLAVLRELPAEYRDVLTLRYLAGADYDTIGKQLALSNGSLRGLLNRGMKLLREKMGQQ
ncbi:MAG TPA: RNA polymerase sigma factor [Tepidisphaeraceae bacterium]|jgi:RNA polymerase sigma-70 factor (ECF subfamily)